MYVNVNKWLHLITRIGFLQWGQETNKQKTPQENMGEIDNNFGEIPQPQFSF